MKIISEHLLRMSGISGLLVKGYKFEGNYFGFIPYGKTNIDDLIVVTESEFTKMSNYAFSWLNEATQALHNIVTNEITIS